MTSMLCVGAGVLLLAAMGVTSLNKEQAAAPRPTPLATVNVASTQATPAVMPTRRAVAPKPASPVADLGKKVREIETRIRDWPEQKRDSEFERQRIIALSELSEVRESLDKYLQKTRDDKADRLWDRLQRVYITVKKL
mgnify:CR=1 FL=1